jgi:dihydroflavonol-4-reductase
LVRPGSNTLTIDDTGVEQAPGDILDPPSVAQAMAGCAAVFHCAAAYTFWARDPSHIYRTNVEGTRNVLAASELAGVSRVVYTSTVGTISMPRQGLGSRQGLAVEDSFPEAPGHLVGNYKKSKYQAEQVALDFAQRGLPVVVVNPTLPVGPWDVRPTPTGRIVLDFLRGRMPAYVNTGLNLVDVADVVAGHILAWQRGIPGERYLLGSQNLTLRELLQLLQQITGKPAPRWRLPFWLALAAGYLDQLIEGVLLGREPRIPLEGLQVARTPLYVSCEKAITQLGLPQSPVAAALEQSVTWFADHGYVR